jgi:lysophospholipase L1-like esterase
MRLTFLTILGLLLLVPLSLAAETSATKPAPAKKEKAAAPAPDWRALFQLHYATRVQEFRQQNLQLQNVILVGDSITEGFDIAKYFPDRRILNRGIGADVIGNALPPDDRRGVLKRLDESIFNCAPRDVFLLIGINDLGDNHTPETMEAGYREILERVKKHSPAVRLHIQSVLPTRGNYAKHNANINDFNQRLQKLAKEFNCDYLDLHSQMTDDRGELKKEFTADGLHLKDLGYKIWKAEIEKKLGW